MFEYLVAFLVVLVFCYYVKSLQFSNRQLPPGPFMAPFGLGIIPAGMIRLKKWPTLHEIRSLRPWEAFHVFYKDFGELYCMQVGNFLGIIVASHDLMTELAPLDEYSIKVSHELFTYPRTFDKELGLIFASTPALWQEMRKFTQRTLREFGFGKRHTMQSCVEAEINELFQEIREIPGCSGNGSGGVMKIRTVFVIPVLNVLWCMVAGKRYSHKDPKLVGLMKRNIAMTKSTTFTDPLMVFAPWLNKHIPWLVKADVRRKAFSECHEFTRKLIQDRKNDAGEQSQSYVDVFLKKIEENKDDPKTIYTEEQLQAMLSDLLQTGSATTNGTLNYGLLYLTLHPHVQKRCREEIDKVVPRHLLPTPEDIEKMPYLRAFILETHRLANVVPNPIPRVVPWDWNFRGYKIPKGAYIVSNHYSVHMDEKYWGDPQVFRPERFLDGKGNFVEDKRVVHFGYGKRICIGITLSNHVISVFLASLVQNFVFSTVPGQPKPTTDPEVGVSLSPIEYSVLVKCREN